MLISTALLLTMPIIIFVFLFWLQRTNFRISPQHLLINFYRRQKMLPKQVKQNNNPTDLKLHAPATNDQYISVIQQLYAQNKNLKNVIENLHKPRYSATGRPQNQRSIQPQNNLFQMISMHRSPKAQLQNLQHLLPNTFQKQIYEPQPHWSSSLFHRNHQVFNYLQLQALKKGIEVHLLQNPYLNQPRKSSTSILSWKPQCLNMKKFFQDPILESIMIGSPRYSNQRMFKQSLPLSKIERLESGKKLEGREDENSLGNSSNSYSKQGIQMKPSIDNKQEVKIVKHKDAISIKIDQQAVKSAKKVPAKAGGKQNYAQHIKLNQIKKEAFKKQNKVVRKLRMVTSQIYKVFYFEDNQRLTNSKLNGPFQIEEQLPNINNFPYC